MAKKKATKKVAKKVAMKPTAACNTENTCCGKGILAILIVILTWWRPAETWAQIVITIAALMILLSGSKCYCKK